MSNCKLCGKPLPERKSKKGRPQEYHADCKSLITSINLLESRLETWRDNKPPKDANNRLRRDIMSLLNSALN